MSVVVTDPYSAWVSPTRRAISTSTPVQAGGFGVDNLALVGFLRVEFRALTLDLFLVAVSGEQGQLARQQVVARIAVGDLDDFAPPTEVIHVVSKNHFH